MRIAQVAPLAESVPPRMYGGTERVASWLTEELVRQGHDVTLFASGDSETSAELVACTPKGLRLAGIRDHTASNLAMLAQVRKRAGDFDIIHFHLDLLPHALFSDLTHKCVTTLHGRLDIPDFMPVYKAFPRMPLISISDKQRDPMPDNVNWLATVPHGMRPDLCPFNANGGEYLAFLGRIAPEKRPDRAIKIAIRAGVPLRIAAKIDKVDEAYFETRIRSMLDHPLIEFIGEIDQEEKVDFLGKARALLFPIDWPEPFGLVMIEAMSAGTPVIAWRNGSTPEVISHGISGALVDSIEEAVTAVHAVEKMNRHDVRRMFEARFTAKRMADDYVKPSNASSPRHNCAWPQNSRRRVGLRRFAKSPSTELAMLQSPLTARKEFDASEQPSEHYIEAQTSLVEKPLRTLKSGDSFAVMSSYGDMGGARNSPEGLFFRDTRYLSKFELTIEGARPLMLSSVIQDDNAVLVVDLANPDIRIDHQDHGIPRDVIAIHRTKFLWQAVCYERIGLRNFDQAPRRFRIAVQFAADYRDLFEVRGMKREQRGTTSVRRSSRSSDLFLCRARRCGTANDPAF